MENETISKNELQPDSELGWRQHSRIPVTPLKITPSTKKKSLKTPLHLVVSFFLFFFAVAYLGYL
jgi:hypothetical protein